MTRRLILAAFAVTAIASHALAQGGAQTTAPSSPPGAGPDATAPKPAETRMLPRTEAMPILGQDVVTANGAAVGRLVDVLVGDDGRPRAAVLDVGGFLGVGNRDVTVLWSALTFAPTDKDHPITTTLTPDQIRAAPDYKSSDKPAAVVVPPKT
jgi:PRC-barrel domain